MAKVRMIILANNPSLKAGVKQASVRGGFSHERLIRMQIFLLTLFLFCIYSSLYSQRLDRFAMSKFAAGGQRGVAYPLQKSFFAKLPSDTIPSYTKNDTTFYFIYLWLPDSVKELGMQLISPVPQFASARKGDYEAEDYHDSLKAYGKYFDPVLIVEHVRNIYSPAEIFTKMRNGKLVGRNDNSQEAPSQPTMMKKNSLLRLGVSATDTAYVPKGLYIISITSADNKKPEGIFVLQVGVTEVIPGLKLFRRQDELSESY
jgi:hypothetical protein